MKENKTLNEFKKFISRGNVVDMAVGVVVGGAFTAIINSVVNDIFMPLVGMLTGGINFTDLKVVVGSAELCYGNFIQALINFLIIAFAMFNVVKLMNRLKKKEEEKPAAPAKPSDEVVLLTEIRDLLKKQ
ncbi:MAG: large-conductance mechanosensitive channel protein MscL [Firmicutes bacterium]|nr:large-conductance mechanosensitive channel protein MscL [Bacillota bacterium]